MVLLVSKVNSRITAAKIVFPCWSRIRRYANLKIRNVCAVMSFTNPNLFVISGGPGAGKTTVLLELEKFGFRHVPEVARQIIQEQVKSGGKALPWEDREAYTHLMLQYSIESYLRHSPAVVPMFSDRGIPDTLSYARLIGFQEEHALQAACRECRHASSIFLAPPWEEIYEIDA